MGVCGGWGPSVCRPVASPDRPCSVLWGRRAVPPTKIASIWGKPSLLCIRLGALGVLRGARRHNPHISWESRPRDASASRRWTIPSGTPLRRLTGVCGPLCRSRFKAGSPISQRIPSSGSNGGPLACFRPQGRAGRLRWPGARAQTAGGASASPKSPPGTPRRGGGVQQGGLVGVRPRGVWILAGVANRQACATFCCDGRGARPNLTVTLKDGAPRPRGSAPSMEFSFPPDAGLCGLPIGMTDGDVCPPLSKAARFMRWWCLIQVATRRALSRVLPLGHPKKQSSAGDYWLTV